MGWPISGRFQVVGYIGESSDGVEMVETREEALSLAAQSVGPGRFDRCVVFDVMARRGAANEWDHTGRVIGHRGA